MFSLHHALLLLGATATLVAADLGKDSLWDGLGDVAAFGDKLPTRGSNRADVDVPDVCNNYAGETNDDGSKFCPGAMSAISVTYDDCSEPWIMCRCDNAQNSFDSMVSQFGRIPVNLRDYVRYIISFAGSESAFSNSQDMVLFGDESSEQGLTVYIHENGHDIDQGVSAGDAFHGALAADTCATDPYGNSSEAEEFAQLTVVSLYKYLFGNYPGNADTGCMANQLNVYQSDSRLNQDAMALGTCDLNVRHSVTAKATRSFKRNAIPRPTSTAAAAKRANKSRTLKRWD